MSSKKIAICGTNGSWKYELMKIISQIHRAEPPIMKSFFDHGIFKAVVKMKNEDIELLSLQDAFINEENAYTSLLVRSNMVIYVVSEAMPKDKNSMKPGSEYDQKRVFNTHLLYSKKFGVSWDYIPWLWVFTDDIPGYLKYTPEDVEFGNPIKEYIPLHGNIVKCSTENNTGIELISSHIERYVV